MREKVLVTATQRSKKAFVTFRAKSGRFLAAGLELANLDELAATAAVTVF
ncbi:MAG: hypothetical protein V3T72_06570 [Thermoanaerobaculia bacterium]